VTRLFAGTPGPPADLRPLRQAGIGVRLPAPGGRDQAASTRKPDGQAGPRKTGQGKIVTVIGALDPGGNDLPALAARLKASCGTGGTIKEGRIELQGDHLQAVDAALQALGYKTKRK